MSEPPLWIAATGQEQSKPGVCFRTRWQSTFQSNLSRLLSCTIHADLFFHPPSDGFGFCFG